MVLQNTMFQDFPITSKSISNNIIKLITGSFIYISLGVTININLCSFTNGIATQGGALYLSGLSTMNISNSFFNNNYAEVVGGSIYLSNY